METRDDLTKRVQRIRDGEILDAIRVRTAMYTGERTLTAAYHFLAGFEFAQHVFELPTRQILPADFHDWVAYRLHYYESTSGYKRMILNRIPDESAALDRFFELLDEYRSRQQTVVAKVRTSNLEVFKYVDSILENKRRATVASEVRLVVYTDDPGFFVIHDDEAAEYPRKSYFCPMLSSERFGVLRDTTPVHVLNQDQYTRLLKEDGMRGNTSAAAQETTKSELDS
jgi:hypothetical protein